MLPRRKAVDQITRTIQQLVLVLADVSNLAMPPQCDHQLARLRKVFERIAGIEFIQPWSATHRQQRIVRDSAQWRTQDRGERQLIGLVIEEAQQLDEVGYLLAFVETTTENRLIRDV